MQLIADSGSTKTDWKIVKEDQQVIDLETVGFNPVLTNTTSIIKTLAPHFADKPLNFSINEVHYYGAGCWDTDSCLVVTKALEHFFPKAAIHVTNDLLGAARAVCGKNAGIACILGTGANSCWFDGQKIVDNIPALGYIMGDEGSGAYLGKQLLRHYFYRELPLILQEKLENTHTISKKILLEKVYEGQQGNRYLASFAKFLIQEKKHPFVRQLLADAFDTFIEKQVLKYQAAPNLPIHFIGSIAYFLADILNEQLMANRLKLGKIIRQPIDGLVKFHQSTSI